MTPKNQQQAELLEQYRLALLENRQAIAPPELDADSAKFTRSLVASQQGQSLSSDVQTRLWQDVLHQTQAESTSHQEEPEPIMLNTANAQRGVIFRPSLALPLVAALAFVLLGGFLVWGMHWQNSATPQSNSGVYLQNTEIPKPTLTPTPSNGLSDATDIEIPATASLDTSQITFVYQTWNNSGPAALAMGLEYLGFDPVYDQALIRASVSPHPEDKFTQPSELADYVRRLDITKYDAVQRIGGNMDVIKRLIANNTPVLVVTGYEPDNENGWFAHYRLVVGYDDATEEIYVFDPYLGNGNGDGRVLSYNEFDAGWRQMNRSFIALYDHKFEDDTSYRYAMNQILGDYGTYNDGERAQEVAIEQATRETETINDLWSWLNLGEALMVIHDYEGAGQAFDKVYADSSISVAHLLWYRQGILEVLFQLQRYEELESLLDQIEATAPDQEVVWYYRGRLHMTKGGIAQYGDAREDFLRALAISPNYLPAQFSVTLIEAYFQSLRDEAPTIEIGNTYELWNCYSRLDFGSVPDTLPLGEAYTTVVQVYEPESHVGIDIEAPEGTEVYATGAGTVVFGGWHAEGYGNAVVIAHLDGENVYFTLYAHLSSVTAFCGQRVETKALLGTVGATGNITSETLHFEVRDADFKPIDPMPFLPELTE